MSEYVVTVADVRKLRDEVGLSMMECKKALMHSNGDFEKAKDLLRAWGRSKSSDRRRYTV